MKARREIGTRRIPTTRQRLRDKRPIAADRRGLATSRDGEKRAHLLYWRADDASPEPIGWQRRRDLAAE